MAAFKGLLVCLVLAVTLGAELQAGQIKPKTSKPISMTYNNKGYTTDYTFKFQIENATPSTGILKIIFPTDRYDSGLGISTAPTCTAQDEKGNAYSSCSVSGRVVSIAFSDISNSPVDNTYTVTIKNVKNPTSEGGTGFFRLQTWKGINLIDDNETFARVGIYASATSPSIASVTCASSSCSASQTSQYNFSFRPSQEVPIDARIMLTFPAELSLPSPAECTSDLITNVICSRSGQVVTISGLSSALSTSTTYTFRFTNVQNPGYSGSINNFSVIVLQGSVNNILDVSSSINAPSISSSSLTVAVCPNASTACSSTDPLVTISNKMYYTVSSTTSTDLPANGKIVVTIPSTYTLISGTCLVLSGLTHYDTTFTNMLTCTVDPTAYTVTITKFGAFTKGTFSFKFQATNPNSGGTKGTVDIKSYYDSAGTKLVDSGSSSSIVVASLTALTSWSLTTTPTTLTPSVLTVIDFSFSSATAFNFPADSISLQFPTSFSFSGTPSATCVISGVGSGTALTASYSSSTGLLTITSSATAAMAANAVHSFTITSTGSGINMPSTAGIYSVEVKFISGSTNTHAFLHYLTVNAATMAGSAKAYSNDVAQMTIYELAFTPTIDVPASSIPSSISSSWGQINVRFPTTTNYWQTDLGTGKTTGSAVTCKGISNISAVTGSSLTCQITLGSGVTSTDYAYVSITGFSKLTAGTAVTLQLVGLQHVDTGALSPVITVEAVSNVQRIPNQTNLAPYTLPKTSYDDNSLSTPITNGRSPSPDGDGKNVVTLSPNSVSLSTVLSFVAWPEYDLAANSAFIMKFPTYYPVPSTVTCYVDYSTTNTCYSYPDSNWILMILSSSTMTKHVEYTISITGFTNPRDQIDLGALSIVAINSNAYESEYIKFADITTLKAGAISPVSLTTSSYQANAVDVTYTWIFTLTNNIELGGKVVLSFPKDNYVTTTSPTLECEVSGTLYAKSKTDPIACAFSANTVTITNFAAHTAGSTISVKVKHVLNPAEPTTTGYFYIETFSARGYLQDTNYTISPIVIYDKVKVGKVSHLQFSANPSNGRATADWTVSFKPSVNYPVGTYIYVAFPISEFTSITSSPTCYIAGGLTTLASCTSDGANTVTLITDTDYTKSSASAPLNITVTDLKSYTGGLTSGVVTITAKYTDITIDASPDSEVNRKFTTDLEYKDMSLKSYYYSPLTAAEPATYNFTLEPTSNFTANCTLNIRFPSTFPRRLGDYVNCTSADISANQGSLPCTVKSRTVTMTGLKSWLVTSGKTFNVTVSGVNNPNLGSSLSNFVIFTQCGAKVYDYVDSLISDVLYNSLPARMSLWNVTTTSAYSLYNSAVAFTANTTVTRAGKDSDLIYLDFPSPYDFTFVKSSVTCDSLLLNQTTTDQCTLTNNRFAVKAYSSSIDNSYNPVVGIKVSGIENPDLIGQTEYVRMTVYDSVNRTIVASTYPNLAQIASLAYEKAGLTLTVNFDQTLTINKGTRSQSLYGIIETTSPTKAVLKASKVPTGVTVIPDTMTYYIGDSTQDFKVSVSQNATVGTYYIEWELTTPDTSFTFFSPVKRMKVEITDTKTEVANITDVTYIPRGGATLPLAIRLSNPVDEELILKFFQVGKLPSGLNFENPVIVFEAGDVEKAYVLSIDEDSIGDTGEFLVTKSGVNSGSYSLTKSSFKFFVTSPDGSNPIVREARLVDTDFTEASFRIIVNEQARIYWAVGNRGSKTPSFEEVKAADNGTNSGFTRLIFGNTVSAVYLAYNKVEYSITVEGLVAQSFYTFYAYVQDLGGNLAEEPIEIPFQTDDRFNSAYMSMKFLSDPLGDDYKIEILQQISEICKIDVSLFDYMDFDTEEALSDPLDQSGFEDDSAPISTTSTFGRATQGITVAKIVIFPDPTSSSQVPPLAYADFLASETVELSRRLSKFDSIYPIQGIEIINKSPVFTLSPSFISVSSSSVELTDLSIDQLGVIYFCGVAARVEPTTPLSWNVIRGLDANNMPCKVYDYVKASTEVTSYEVEGFDPEERYWLYIAATNQIQRYPAESKEVYVLGFQSDVEDTDAAVALAVSVGLGLALY